jgi:hypothetical protein
MKQVFLVIFALFLLLGLAANAEQFSKLPTKEYYFLYEKSTNVENLQFSTVYTVRQVEDGLHCPVIVILDFLDGNDRGLLIVGQDGDDFKIVVLLIGIEEEHWV